MAMESWRDRLYRSYVSSGQAARDLTSDNQRMQPSPYRHFLSRHLPQDPATRILDLGCGHGSLLACLKELGFHNIEGLDYSAEQIELAHQLGIKEAMRADIMPYLEELSSNQTDAICMMDVIEHIDRDHLFPLLDEVWRVLRPGGKLILHAPNAEGIFGLRMRYGDLTHELSFTPRSIHQLLTTCGYHRIQASESKPHSSSATGLLRKVAWEILSLYPRMLYIAETGRLNPVLTQNMLVVASKP